MLRVTRTFRLLSWALLMGSFQGQLVSQVQTPLRGSLDGFDEGQRPSVLHVRHFDAPAVGLGDWTDVALVRSDGSFEVDLGALKAPVLYEFSAPPWSWMTLVRPGESSVLSLSPASRASSRLMQVPGASRWIGHHPSASLDSLARIQQGLMQNLVEPMTARSWGVQPSNIDSLEQVSLALDSAFQEAWTSLEQEMNQPVFDDLWWQAQWRWQLALGATETTLDSLWSEWNAGRPHQELANKLCSPGWIEAWYVRYDQWWKHRQVDSNGLSKAVYLANLDTLRVSMGQQWSTASTEDLAAAWLLKALSAPDELTFRIWETMAFPEPFRIQYKRLMASRNPRSAETERAGIRWTMPNGDLQSYSDVCPNAWKVMLVVRNGSGAALRERELFAEITESDVFANVCFFVLSVDATQSDWRSSLSKRRSLEEQLVWLGNNPQNYEALEISTIPQIVAVSPGGQMSQSIRSLPSQGLARELERELRSYRSGY
jgi:hypothetical protein